MEIPQESEITCAAHMRQLADRFADEPVPSAASMWWRISLRLRREKARRAEQPLIWMTRISRAVAAVAAVTLAVSTPIPARPAAEIGIATLAAIVIPIAIVLWRWSRSNV